jgi:hypothetical protein
VEIEVSAGAQEDVDALAPLWAAMLEHHRAIAGNDGAQRLYERLGFAPWTQRMLAPLQ